MAMEIGGGGGGNDESVDHDGDHLHILALLVVDWLLTLLLLLLSPSLEYGLFGPKIRTRTPRETNWRTHPPTYLPADPPTA